MQAKITHVILIWCSLLVCCGVQVVKTELHNNLCKDFSAELVQKSGSRINSIKMSYISEHTCYIKHNELIRGLFLLLVLETWAHVVFHNNLTDTVSLYDITNLCRMEKEVKYMKHNSLVTSPVPEGWELHRVEKRFMTS